MERAVMLRSVFTAGRLAVIAARPLSRLERSTIDIPSPPIQRAFTQHVQKHFQSLGVTDQAPATQFQGGL